MLFLVGYLFEYVAHHIVKAKCAAGCVGRMVIIARQSPALQFRCPILVTFHYLNRGKGYNRA